MQTAKENTRHQINVRLPEPKFAIFRELCRKRGYSVTASVNLLIDQFLEKSGISVEARA